MWIGTKTATRF